MKQGQRPSVLMLFMDWRASQDAGRPQGNSLSWDQNPGLFHLVLGRR